MFFGGGTPSLFEARSIDRLLAAFDADAGFTDRVEITLEANPGTVSPKRLRGFREAGVNRISFGIQSFDPHFLKLLGRGHTVHETREAAPLARAAGFDNLSLDLIFALPGQTLESWRSDLDTAVSFEPDHVSALPT